MKITAHFMQQIRTVPGQIYLNAGRRHEAQMVGSLAAAQPVRSAGGRLSCCRAAGTREPHSCASHPGNRQTTRLIRQRVSENRRRTPVRLIQGTGKLPNRYGNEHRKTGGALLCVSPWEQASSPIDAATSIGKQAPHSCASHPGNRQTTRLIRQRASENRRRTPVRLIQETGKLPDRYGNEHRKTGTAQPGQFCCAGCAASAELTRLCFTQAQEERSFGQGDGYPIEVDSLILRCVRAEIPLRIQSDEVRT